MTMYGTPIKPLPSWKSRRRQAEDLALLATLAACSLVAAALPAIVAIVARAA